MTRSSCTAAIVIPTLACIWAWGHVAESAEPDTQAPAAANPEDEPIETLDSVEDVTSAVAQPSGSDLTLAQIVGRLHPAAVHLPIGWIILLMLWEALVIITRRREFETVGLDLGVGAVLSTVPAVVTGLLRAQELSVDPTTVDEIGDHRTIMLAATAVTIIAVLLRLYRRQGPLAGLQRSTYMALLVLASLLLTVGGHWGGELVFGESYLPF